jgi:hypothetical protein
VGGCGADRLRGNARAAQVSDKCRPRGRGPAVCAGFGRIQGGPPGGRARTDRARGSRRAAAVSDKCLRRGRGGSARCAAFGQDRGAGPAAAQRATDRGAGRGGCGAATARAGRVADIGCPSRERTKLQGKSTYFNLLGHAARCPPPADLLRPARRGQETRPIPKPAPERIVINGCRVAQKVLARDGLSSATSSPRPRRSPRSWRRVPGMPRRAGPPHCRGPCRGCGGRDAETSPGAAGTWIGRGGGRGGRGAGRARCAGANNGSRRPVTAPRARPARRPAPFRGSRHLSARGRMPEQPSAVPPITPARSVSESASRSSAATDSRIGPSGASVAKTSRPGPKKSSAASSPLCPPNIAVSA